MKTVGFVETQIGVKGMTVGVGREERDLERKVGLGWAAWGKGVKVKQRVEMGVMEMVKEGRGLVDLGLAGLGMLQVKNKLNNKDVGWLNN